MIYWSCPRLPQEMRDSLLAGAGNDLLCIRQALLQWYSRNRRLLPWRRTRDPYRIWVSEVMLQQTQVDTVIPYYLRFIERFPTLESLAESDVQAVLAVWEGLGYYARARNLHRAARSLVEERGGRVPTNFREFRKLPGVGEYIAAAVMSIAFGHPHAAVDGNVKRVLARLFRIERPADGSGGTGVFREKASELLDPSDPGTFNQAVMELGAVICAPRNPRCPVCPIAGFCAAHRSGMVEAYPRRTRPQPIPTHRVAVGVVHRGKRVLIVRRPSEGLLGGLWEFPGGKAQPGESAERTCLREIREETGIEAEILHHLARVRHAYSHFRIMMDVFECQWISGRVRLNGPAAHRWVEIEDLEGFPFPQANRRFMPLLRVPGTGGLMVSDH